MTSPRFAIWARRFFWGVTWFFVLSLINFGVMRGMEVQADLADGVPPEPDDFNTRYTEEQLVALGHIVPGSLFIVVAPFQLSRRVRRWSIGVHRVLGRIGVVAGLISAIFAIIFGVLFPWGGFFEQSASIVFGFYMSVALTVGVLAARRKDVVAHRRWMIRGFAVALGVATIRLVLISVEKAGLYSFDDAFGWAFWVGLSINAAVAEAWLRTWPRSPSLRLNS